jgi:hypothetical protein
MGGIIIARIHVSVVITYYVYTMDYNLKLKTIKGNVKQLCYMVDSYV